MRRDMDLVRDILAQLAESSSEVDASAFVDSRNPFDKVAYHFEIMDEAGLIHASVHKAFGDEYVLATASKLTWEGNDFLASIANEGVWKKVKQDISKAAVDMPLSIVKQLATRACESLLGL